MKRLRDAYIDEAQVKEVPRELGRADHKESELMLSSIYSRVSDLKTAHNVKVDPATLREWRTRKESMPASPEPARRTGPKRRRR